VKSDNKGTCVWDLSLLKLDAVLLSVSHYFKGLLCLLLEGQEGYYYWTPWL